jgi:hypothetical protein
MVLLLLGLPLIHPSAQGPTQNPTLRSMPTVTPSKSPSDSSLAPRIAAPHNPKDSAAVPAKPKSRADSVLVPKHAFNHREQLITGSVVMSCLLVILLAMNNYNPR